MLADINTINGFLQGRLRDWDKSEVTAVEAAQWLDNAKLLSDSDSRPGRPLRDLLRKGLIVGQRQELNGRWFIDRV
ncbi:MAG: hypothetical protein IBX64_09445 [Actinobacteria bacterium]|nr:hypothetical protein [Actinomycetota bacterium]